MWMGTRVAGEVRDVDLDACLSEGEQAELVRSARLAIHAANEAVTQSGLDVGALDPYRVGLAMGTCQGSLGELQSTRRTSSTPSTSRATPWLATSARGPG